MIIDIHTHTFPDKIAAATLDKLKHLSHTIPFADGTAAGLAASMARAGVDRSVVMPVATSPRQVPHVNDASARMNELGAQTGVLSFGCMHPDFDGWKEELARVRDLGLKGIKLHPQYQDTDFDDPRYLRILDRCGELGLVVLTHAGLDIGCTMIGMHLREVAVPLRLQVKQVGEAAVSAARTRPKLIGGARAVYPEKV